MLNKMRDWSFPIGVLLAWTLTASYAVATIANVSVVPQITAAPRAA